MIKDIVAWYQMHIFEPFASFQLNYETTTCHLAILLGMAVMIQLYEQSTVHAAVFWVMAAAACDSFSSRLTRKMGVDSGSRPPNKSSK